MAKSSEKFWIILLYLGGLWNKRHSPGAGQESLKHKIIKIVKGDVRALKKCLIKNKKHMQSLFNIAPFTDYSQKVLTSKIK